MPKLLVSVRSAEEAQDALAGGASFIDVKEPSRGSLGRAATSTIVDVMRCVAGRVPVSAALGDLPQDPEHLLFPGLSYVKWGLARSRTHWQPILIEAARKLALSNSPCLHVAVAYADWQEAQAPTPDCVLAFVRNHAWPVFLLDTWQKDGQTILDWLSSEEIRTLCQICRRCGIQIALAGSLGMDQISELLPLQPDIVAVRRAACRANDRNGTVDRCRVRVLADMLNA